MCIGGAGCCWWNDINFYLKGKAYEQANDVNG